MTTPLPAISLTVTAAFVILSVVFSIVVGAHRAKTGIMLLHGDDEALLRKIRAHGNFTEYAPLALLALLGAEVAGAPPVLVAGCGGALIVARLVHFFGLTASAHSKGRVIGAALTTLAMLVLAAALLWHLWAAG